MIGRDEDGPSEDRPKVCPKDVIGQTRTFLDGEALRIFELKAKEPVQETAANLKIVMNHVVTYFGPNEYLSKQKQYLRHNMIKPLRLTTRQYVGLVRDLNSWMDQLPPLFEDSQFLDESELVDSRRLFGERVDQFIIIKNLRVLEERWQLSHP